MPRQCCVPFKRPSAFELVAHTPHDPSSTIGHTHATQLSGQYLWVSAKTFQLSRQVSCFHNNPFEGFAGIGVLPTKPFGLYGQIKAHRCCRLKIYQWHKTSQITGSIELCSPWQRQVPRCSCTCGRRCKVLFWNCAM